MRATTVRARPGHASPVAMRCGAGEDQELVAGAFESLAAEGVRERGSPGASTGGAAAGHGAPELSGA